MDIKTFQDLIDWTRSLHSNIAKSFDDNASGSRNEYTNQLMEYLASHERKMSALIDDFEKEADTNVLQTRVYDHIQHSPVELSNLGAADYADMSFEDICKSVFHFHDEVAALYRYLAGKAETAAVKELLEELLQMQDSESKRLAQQINRMRDL